MVTAEVLVCFPDVPSSAPPHAPSQASSPTLRPLSNEQQLRHPKRAHHLPMRGASIARDRIHLRNRDNNAAADRSSGSDLSAGPPMQLLSTQFPVVQRFNETVAGGRPSAIILESNARARDLMRRQQPQALRQLCHPDGLFAPASLAIEACALAVSVGLSGAAGSAHMLPPLPPKKLK
jgi:hypothetical protein